MHRLKMLTLRQPLSAISPVEWFTTIDLTDSYFHITIHPDHRQFLRFAFEGLVQPIGMSLAPFTRCVKAALALLRQTGVGILAYLDDCALVASSEERAAT